MRPIQEDPRGGRGEDTRLPGLRSDLNETLWWFALKNIFLIRQLIQMQAGNLSAVSRWSWGSMGDVLAFFLIRISQDRSQCTSWTSYISSEYFAILYCVPRICSRLYLICATLVSNGLNWVWAYFAKYYKTHKIGINPGPQDHFQGQAIKQTKKWWITCWSSSVDQWHRRVQTDILSPSH